VFDPLTTRLRHDRTYLRLAANPTTQRMVQALSSERMEDKTAALAAIDRYCEVKACDWNAIGAAVLVAIMKAPRWTSLTWRETILGNVLVTAFSRSLSGRPELALAKPGWRRQAGRALLESTRSGDITSKRAACSLLARLPGIELRADVQSEGSGQVRVTIAPAELARVRRVLGLPPLEKGTVKASTGARHVPASSDAVHGPAPAPSPRGRRPPPPGSGGASTP